MEIFCIGWHGDNLDEKEDNELKFDNEIDEI